MPYRALWLVVYLFRRVYTQNGHQDMMGTVPSVQKHAPYESLARNVSRYLIYPQRLITSADQRSTLTLFAAHRFGFATAKSVHRRSQTQNPATKADSCQGKSHVREQYPDAGCSFHCSELYMVHLLWQSFNTRVMRLGDMFERGGSDLR